MNFDGKRILKRGLAATGALLVLALLLFGAGWWYLHPGVERVNGIVYGERGGRPLTMDVLRASSPNGRGVVVLVSGSWRSKRPGEFAEWIAAPLLRRGYTVFAVCHVSQPQATVPEIVADVQRAVRFIRRTAGRHGVDPACLGVTGGSSGGHLSLMLATTGDAGRVEAPDPVERESSAVQAVAIFFPVTDLLNLGPSSENLGDGGPPKSFVKAFGPEARDPARWKVIGREVSPIYHVSAAMPPVLIHHGDADTLTPLEQSERFRDAARNVGKEVVLRVHSGGMHGWLTMPWDVYRFADWFDRYLR
jgi:acetyl esterase/lipase